MAMVNYFNAFGPQIDRMRRETGTVSAISGMFKAPFDILADKLRGYIGLAIDLMEVPEKVLAACEALMPHLRQRRLGRTRPEPAGPHPHLDAPRLRAVHLARTLRHDLLAHAQADRRGALGARQPDPVLRRGQVGRPPRRLSPNCRRQHRLPRRPGRHRLRPRETRRQVLPERRRPQRRCSPSARPTKCASALQGSSSTPSRATAATSWTPAPSCRTTRPSRTSRR